MSPFPSPALPARPGLRLEPVQSLRRELTSYEHALADDVRGRFELVAPRCREQLFPRNGLTSVLYEFPQYQELEPGESHRPVAVIRLHAADMPEVPGSDHPVEDVPA